MIEKFQLNKTLLGPDGGRPFQGSQHDGVRIGHNMSDIDVVRLYDELEIYSILEEELSCSGMCERSLFYFSRNITEGAPKQTCLLKFKSYMEFLTQAYGATSILCGMCILVMFLLHFCLYCRPSPEYNKYADPNDAA